MCCFELLNCYIYEASKKWRNRQMKREQVLALYDAYADSIYRVALGYEKAYYYTTQSGCEFLITADSGHVWAECCTAHANVSLSGAYLTTDAVEQIVEHLALSIKE